MVEDKQEERRRIVRGDGGYREIREKCTLLQTSDMLSNTTHSRNIWIDRQNYQKAIKIDFRVIFYAHFMYTLFPDPSHITHIRTNRRNLLSAAFRAYLHMNEPKLLVSTMQMHAHYIV